MAASAFAPEVANNTKEIAAAMRIRFPVHWVIIMNDSDSCVQRRGQVSRSVGVHRRAGHAEIPSTPAIVTMLRALTYNADVVPGTPLRGVGLRRVGRIFLSSIRP